MRVFSIILFALSLNLGSYVHGIQGTNKNEQNNDIQQVRSRVNGEWYLIEVLGLPETDFVFDKKILLNFESKKHRFQGFNGCGIFSGVYANSDNVLKFWTQNPSSTSCDTDSIIKEIPNILFRCNYYKIEGNKLLLMDTLNIPLLVFSRSKK